MTDCMTKPAETLGDPQTVKRLLSIVTGNRFLFTSLVPVASACAGARWPAEAQPRGHGTTLTLERTPAPIRALRDEGIIGTWSGRLAKG